MIKYVLFVAAAIMGSLFLNVPSAGAEAVRIKPLQYLTELKKGEKKKGFVDITNPLSEPVTVNLYTEGFSQVDNDGNLSFFKSEQITKGLLLDYDTAVINPKQTLRLFFIADGTKLPTGDVFGVIFAETKPLGLPGSNTAVRVGTLVAITNQTPGARHAEITDVKLPFFNIGNSINGTITVRNPAPKNSATGFFPKMSVSVSPWGDTMRFKGPLIFAGNSRTSDFQVPSNQLGFYTVTIRANDATISKLVFIMTGWWRIIGPGVILLVIGIIVITWKYRCYLSQKIRPKQRFSRLRRKRS